MRCLKCNNTKCFIIFGNQNLRVKFKDSHLEEIEKEDFDISDIYPVICGKCQSENVDFNHLEIKEIFNRVK